VAFLFDSIPISQHASWNCWMIRVVFKLWYADLYRRYANVIILVLLRLIVHEILEYVLSKTNRSIDNSPRTNCVEKHLAKTVTVVGIP